MPTLLLDIWGAALQISVLYHDRPEFPSKTVHTHTLDTAAGDTASCALGAKKKKFFGASVSGFEGAHACCHRLVNGANRIPSPWA